MLSAVAVALFLLANLLALVMIPFGLPGTLLQVAAAAGLTAVSGGALLGWRWVGVFLALALAAEGVELAAGQWGVRRFGGSRRAAWGALLGGMMGAMLGNIPIPVVGSLLMSFLGTFVGAIVGEMSARTALAPDLRVGLGAVLARTAAVATKLALAFAILIASVALLLLR